VAEGGDTRNWRRELIAWMSMPQPETNFHDSESETEANSYEKKWRQL
jgi:hypothetical protein